MMTRTLLCVALTCIAYTSAFGQVTVRHGDLSVTLPNEPKRDTVEVEDGTQQHRLNLNLPNGAIIVWHQEAKEGVTDHEPGLQSAQDTIVRIANGPVVESKKIELEGNPGRYFIVSIPEKDGEFRVGYYYAKGKHYQVMAVGAKDFTRSEDVDKMFSSLTFKSEKIVEHPTGDESRNRHTAE